MSEALRLADGLLAETSKFGTPSIQRGLLNGAIQELRRLHAENEALRADAERWRWIADGNNFDESFALLTDPKLTTYELTQAVDAARKEST